MSNNSYDNKKSNKFIQDNIVNNDNSDNIFSSMNTRNLIGQNLKKNVDYTKSNSNNNVNPKKSSLLSTKKDNGKLKSNNTHLNNSVNTLNNTNRNNQKKKKSFFGENNDNITSKQNNFFVNNDLNAPVKKSNYVDSQRVSNNEQSDKKSNQQLDITILFIWILFGFAFVVMFVNVVDYYKDGNNGNNSDNDVLVDEYEEMLKKQEENKKELGKMCSWIDSYGNYNYEKYVSHIGESDINNLTDEEMFKVLSEVNYCYQNLCILVEETGIINYMDCTNESYSRVTYDEYQDLFKQQTEYEELLDKACDNIQSDGSYDSGAASGTRVTCNNYVCSIDYDGQTVTKSCK